MHSSRRATTPPFLVCLVCLLPVGAAAQAADAAPSSLERILAFADAHAPSIRIARERLGLGDAAVVAASPLLPENPELSVGVGPGFNTDNHVDFTASLSQRIEIAGERGLRIAAAEQRRAHLQAEFEERRWEVHRDVHAAFHAALVARERLAAAERVLAFQERLLGIAQGRLRAGDVSPLVTRLAEGELSQSRVALIAAEQAYLQARLQLGALAGWAQQPPPVPAGRLDAPRDPPGQQALLAAAQRHQPRLRVLAAAHQAAQAQVAADRRDAWPEPTIGVQVMRERFPAGPPETQVLGVLSMPIPLVRRNQGAQAQSLAESRVAGAERHAFASQLPIRIEQHRTAVLAAAAQLRTYGVEILPTFEENLRLIQRAFELGEIDILQVSVARERFLRIQADALDAYAHYFGAIADLEGTIGADLWPEEQHEHGAGSTPAEGVAE